MINKLFKDLLKSIDQAREIHRKRMKNKDLLNGVERAKENYWKRTELRKKKFLIELNKKTEITNKQLDKLLLKYDIGFKDVVVVMIQSGWIDNIIEPGKIELRRIK